MHPESSLGRVLFCTWSLLTPPRTLLTHTPQTPMFCLVPQSLFFTEPSLADGLYTLPASVLPGSLSSVDATTWDPQLPFRHLFLSVLSLLPPRLSLSSSADCPQTPLSQHRATFLVISPHSWRTLEPGSQSISPPLPILPHLEQVSCQCRRTFQKCYSKVLDLLDLCWQAL